MTWIETPYKGYHVNELGEVRGRFGRVLKPGHGGGKYRTYLYIHVYGVGSKSVHRLVAEAFLGPCPEGKEVAHSNGDSEDNRAVNLTYKTKAQNAADKKLHGTENQGWVPGEKNGRSKLTEAQVIEIRSTSGPINKSELSRRYGVSRTVIAGVLNRSIWRHI